MLEKSKFIDFIINGPEATTAEETNQDMGASLPGGFGDFGFTSDETQTVSTDEDSSFARLLIEASGFGNAEFLEQSEVILGTDPVAKYLPEKAYYWPKDENRPYQTLLFELDLAGDTLLKTSLFKSSNKQNILEDALDRCVQHVLKGFEKGGKNRTASVKGGKQEETLCVVSVKDHRVENGFSLRLVCFATKNLSQGSLETFHIKEEVKLWEPQLRDDYLTRLYDRHFSKLASEKWQDAFISDEERKLTRKLLDTCTESTPDADRIAKQTIKLLEEVAKSFGLRRKSGKRLIPYGLPMDHEIGINSESRSEENNPFKGMTVRDESNQLLGYIIYCLDKKKDADQLRKHLVANNRFHNVLVIYPDDEEAVMELWQGKTKLEGKLTKQGSKFEGEGKIVNLLSRFFVVSKSKIKNPVELAEELAYRARYLRKLALKQLHEEKKDGQLRALYNSFKKALIHDQTEEEFSDSYAQTLTYGLLSARWISKDIFAEKGERFTREKALQYFPNTSPFLKEFFSIVLQSSFEFKLTWLLEDIADLLDRININKVFESVEDSDLGADPVIHFYEPFLAAYDANLKKARGVYYTPKPVVSFIVRSVDKLLTDDFGLQDGLADTTTWGQMIKLNPELKIPKDVSKNEPFIQILDPATGTGTFLVEVIDLIHKRMMTKWNSEDLEKHQIVENWKKYVSKHLLPRFYGFELMMASYVIAHMKIGLKLNETGYVASSKDQVHINLTNTLEDYNELEDQFNFEIEALSKEAKNVNNIKRLKRYTVVIGNPPYSGHSSNNNEWISSLLRKKLIDGADSYFKVDGKDLGERNPKWLNDDYVKFIRYSQSCIAEAGVGILGFITNHGYLDNPTFRGMRQSLLKTFSKRTVIDLHGNLKKKEKNPDGSKDENVFDIQQGVSIGIFSKFQTKQKQDLLLNHMDLWGVRKASSTNIDCNFTNSGKYDFLLKNDTTTINFNAIRVQLPLYLFVPQDIDLLVEYNNGFQLTDIFLNSSVGIVTARDKLTIRESPEEVWKTVNDFAKLPTEDARIKYQLGKDVKDWKVHLAQKDIVESGVQKKNIIPIAYRPFDIRYTYYTGKTKGFICRPRKKIMQHMITGDNIALISARSNKSSEMNHFFCSEYITETKLGEASTQSCVFPLYLYPDNNEMFSTTDRESNINPIFLQKLKLRISESFLKNTTPELIFNYIYAIFYSPIYRKRYKQFIKNDFPKVPISSDSKLFMSLSKIGKQIIMLHTFRTNDFSKTVLSKVKFLGDGNQTVEKIKYKENELRLYINKNQYFERISPDVWNFSIGGYKICEKWLKYKKKQVVSSEEINHLQKVFIIIDKTIKLMSDVDNVIEHHGGWPGAFITKKGNN